jgi:hypothetical protein
MTGWTAAPAAGAGYCRTAMLRDGGAHIFLTRNRNLDCEGVNKVPRSAILENKEFAGRFARDTRSLSLAHSNIVKASD